MGTIKTKDGENLDYTKKSYDMQSQTNEPERKPLAPIRPNFFDVNAETIEEQSKYVAPGSDYSITEADWDRRYDSTAVGVSSYEDLMEHRINTQSGFTKGALALGNGLIGAVGTILKELGYMTSPQSYQNWTEWHSTENMNAVSKAMVKVGDFFEQGSEEWAPIYESASDGSIYDQITKWGTVKGMIQSSIGFLVPGIGAAKLIPGAVKVVSLAGKLTKYIGAIQKVNKVTRAGIRLERANKALDTIATAFPKINKVLNTATAVYVQGTGEAVWESIDAHDEFLKDLSHEINLGTVDAKEAVKIANGIAEKTFQMNMVKSLLNTGMLSNFTKGAPGLLKGGVWNYIKGGIKESPLEGLEEGAQNIFKKEAEYQVIKEYADMYGNSPLLRELKKKNKWENGTSSDLATRIGDWARTNEVITDAIIGAISGPMQSGIGSMMRGNILPGSAYRAHQKEFNKQQKSIQKLKAIINDEAEMQKRIAKVANDGSNIVEGASKETILQSKKVKKDSKEEILKQVERAAIAEELRKLTEDSPAKYEIAKEMVYSAIIQESMSKGTFTALLAEAEKLKDNGSESADLYKYAKKAEKKFNKANRYQNTSEVVSAMNKVEALNKFIAEEEKQKALIEAQILKNGSSTIEESEAIEDSNNAIKSLTAKRDAAVTLYKELTSFKYQANIFREEQEKAEVENIINSIDKIDTSESLENLAKLYPGLKDTKEYIIRAKELSGESPAKEGKPTVQTKSTTDAKPATTPEGSDKITAWDDNAIDIYVSTQFPAGQEVTEAEMADSRAGLRAISDTLIKKGITQKEYNDAMKKASLNAGVALRNKRMKESEEGKALEKESKREARRQRGVSGVRELPEVTLDKIAEVTNMQKANLDKIESIRNDTELSDEDKDAQVLAINKENAGLAQELRGLKKEFTDGAELENGTTKWKKLKKDWKSFINYIKTIQDEEFITNNFEMLKNIFTGLDPKNIKGTIAKTRKNDKEGVVNGLAIGEVDLEINANSKLEHNNKLNNEQLNRQDGVKESRISYNKNPAESIAHKSVSSVEGEVDGEIVIADNSNPVYNMSDILDPDKYNGGEPLTLEAEWDYEGNIVMYPDGSKQKIMVPWEKLAAILGVSNVNKDGSIDLSTEALAEIKRKYNVTLDSVYDIIPVVIKNSAGEVLGYMHTPSWINSRTAEVENIIPFRDALQKNRAVVLNSALKGKVTPGTIRQKVIGRTPNNTGYSGFRINNTSDWHKADKGIPERQIMGVVGTSTIHLTEQMPKDNILNFDEVVGKKTGQTLVLVPVGKIAGKIQYHAEVLYADTLTPELKESANKILETFLSKDTTSDVYKFYKGYGYDITKVKDANKVLSTFMFIFEEISSEKKDSFENHMLKKTSMSANIFLREGDNGNEILFGIKGSRTITTKGYADSSLTYEEFIEDSGLSVLFRDNLFLFNTNLSYLKAAMNGKKVPPRINMDEKGNIYDTKKPYDEYAKSHAETRMQGVQIKGKEKYVYTVQNIVEFEVEGSNATPKPTPAIEKETELKEGIVVTEPTETNSNNILEKLGVDKIIAVDSKSSFIETMLNLDSAAASSLSALLKSTNPDTELITNIIQMSPVYKKDNPPSVLSFYDELSPNVQKNLHALYFKSKTVTLDKIKKDFENTKRSIEAYSALVNTLLTVSNMATTLQSNIIGKKC